MPQPKKKHSRTRTLRRRAGWKIAVPPLTACPKCQQPMVPHRACPHCGTYQGRQVIDVTAREKESGE